MSLAVLSYARNSGRKDLQLQIASAPLSSHTSNAASVCAHGRVMTASTRSIVWLAFLFLGLLPLAPDSEEPVPPAWDQLAVWEDSEPDTSLLGRDLTHPDTKCFPLQPFGLPSLSLLSGRRFLPPEGRRQFPRPCSFSSIHPRASPPIAHRAIPFGVPGQPSWRTLPGCCTGRLPRGVAGGAHSF